MALGFFKPVAGKQLPNFTALKLTAGSAGFTDGGAGILDIVAQGITVDLNLGGPLVKGIPFAGDATIDFPASFKGDANAHPVVPPGYPVATGTTTEPIYLDFAGELIRASVEHATLQISDFVFITGSFAFEKGPIATVHVTGGATSAATTAFLKALKLDLPPRAIPALGASTTELSFMTIGASNVHAFIGMNGPYWTDLNLNGAISWAFNTGHGDDASRTFTGGPVTIGSVVYFSGTVLPKDVVATLVAGNQLVTIGGVTYGDINGDGIVDVGETGELNGKATGLVIDDFDFGLAIMR